MTEFTIKQVEAVLHKLVALATCAACGGRPGISCVDPMSGTHGAKVCVSCHGQTELVAVLSLSRDMQWAMDFPRRFFLRRVASTGTMSSAARLERRNRLRACT